MFAYCTVRDTSPVIPSAQDYAVTLLIKEPEHDAQSNEYGGDLIYRIYSNYNYAIPNRREKVCDPKVTKKKMATIEAIHKGDKERRKYGTEETGIKTEQNAKLKTSIVFPERYRDAGLADFFKNEVLRSLEGRYDHTRDCSAQIAP